jgi:hypothetical protein
MSCFFARLKNVAIKTFARVAWEIEPALFAAVTLTKCDRNPRFAKKRYDYAIIPTAIDLIAVGKGANLFVSWPPPSCP